MKILVTGASGFVGRALCSHLQVCGHEVVCASRRPQSPQAVIVDDLRASTDWHQALQGCEAIVHLAARVHVMRDEAIDPLAEFRKVNVDGSLNFARQAAAAGVRRFVFLSSLKVNGEIGRFTEIDTPAPEDAYAVSKWEAEQGLLALACNSGMEVVIIRPPLVYGPGVKGNFAALVKWVRKGIPLPFGAVSNLRSFVALDNLVSFIALCADRDQSPKAANEVFLISDDEDVSTTELLRRVARAYGKKASLIPMPVNWMRFGAKLVGKAAVADRLLGSLVVDSSKARDLLGWHPPVTMDAQLREMAGNVARS